jgi:hypothetical protein
MPCRAGCVRAGNDSVAGKLRTRLLLLVLEKGKERHTGNLDNLEADTRQITNRVTRPTKARDKNFIVLFNKVQTPITRDEGSDLLAVLDKLNTARLPDGRVRLLRLDANTLEHNALCVRGTPEGIGLESGRRMLP